MAYKLGATTVIDDAALIPWARISGGPATPTTASTLSLIAGGAAGGVGTYAWLGTAVTSLNLQAGSVLAGSGLYTGGITYFGSNGYATDTYYNVNGIGAGASGQQSGSWRLMGRIRSDTSTNQAGGSLFLRIS
jgi:hypothetical protein